MADRIDVMISSTSRDLPEHRKAVTDAVLRLGMFPLTYETLPASGETAIQAALGLVDEADLYIGIFALRYGYVPDDISLNPNRISLTEMEYRRAVERGIPLLIFMSSADAPVRPENIETGEGAEKLNRLKDEIRSKYVVGFFSTPEDLASLAITSLVQWRDSRFSTENPPVQQKRTKTAPQSKRAPRKGGDPVDYEEEDDDQPAVQVAVQTNAPANNIDPSGGGTPPTPPPPTFPLLGSLRGAGNDRVSDQDQLGFNNYVYAFADLIEARDTNPPLTIGIYGSWGSGKSFLLNSIVRELDKPSQDRLKDRKAERVVRKVRVIEFNAWEYNATEVIWAGLVRKIIDKLEGELRLGSLERRARRVRYNFGRHWRQTRGRFFGQVLLMFLLAAALVIGRNWLTGSDIESLSELLIPIVGVGSLLTLANGLREALTSPVSQWLTALFEEGDYGRQIDYMADIREDLQFLEKRLGQAQERVLIIIDDLDRCEPTKAVEVLQAINLLLNFNHFIVILGIDARIITGAISKYYANLLEGAGASGYEYLDKIIQIPFRIPTPNRAEIQDFLSKQMGDPKAPVTETPEERTAALKRLLDEETDRVATAANVAPAAEPVAAPPVRTRAEAAFGYDELRAFQQIADVLRPNPRHLKRLVNVYRLVRTLADYRSASVILDNPAATIRWLVLSAQWSYTSYVMLRCYDDWCEKPAGRAAVVQACGSNDPLLWLYGKVKPVLDPARQTLLDDDPDLLEALLNLPQGRVSWDELDIIRRYTINFNPAVEGESFSANGQISLQES